MLYENCNSPASSDKKNDQRDRAEHIETLQEAANRLMKAMEYYPKNKVHDCNRVVEHPDTVTQEEFDQWKASLAELGPYQGMAVYLITDYQYGGYAKPIPIHVLFNLFLGKNIFPLTDNPYRDGQVPQEIFSPTSDAMRNIAKKFCEIHLLLHVVWQEEDPSQMQGYVVLHPKDFLDHYPQQKKNRVDAFAIPD